MSTSEIEMPFSHVAILVNKLNLALLSPVDLNVVRKVGFDPIASTLSHTQIFQSVAGFSCFLS